jgi:endonuclease/exonuclease/phosphatase family metal-dependent hydrolase
VSEQHPGSQPDTELRIVTYNVRGLRAGAKRVGAVLAALRPDIVAIQEGPRRLRWRSRSAELARLGGLYVLAGGRPAAGNLLLCAARVRALRTADHLLPRGNDRQQRGAATAVIEVGGRRIGVVGWHAALTSDARAMQAEMVARLAAGLRADGAEAVLVAGDLNAAPSTRPLAALAGSFQDCWAVAPEGAGDTYPADAPHTRIDAVFASAETTVLGCGVPAVADPGASDHLPVLARLRLGGAR